MSPRLRRSDCSGPGIRRVRRGKGFSYHELGGELIQDRETLGRIEELAIPPAWNDVWVCAHANGHIQATGVDAAGRKQYLYHEKWREDRDREKFDHMIEFARALPRLRRRLEEDLELRGLARRRVLACAVRLLDLGFFRVGSEQYAAENETYGLATLRKRHLSFKRGEAVFDYDAKGSKHVVRAIADPEAVAVLKALKARRGGGDAQLFAYYEGRQWRTVSSDNVNAYLKDAVELDASAKDFRTWNATVLAAVGLAARVPDGERPPRAKRKRLINQTIEEVAEHLSNTPAVCRASYVDPRVLDRFTSDITTLDPVLEIVRSPPRDRFVERERLESAVLEMIE